MDLYQTKNLLYNKGNQQNQKVTYRMGENMCKLHTLKLIFKYIRNTDNAIIIIIIWKNGQCTE